MVRPILMAVEMFFRIHIAIVTLYIISTSGNFKTECYFFDCLSYPFILGLISIVWILIPFINQFILEDEKRN